MLCAGARATAANPDPDISCKFRHASKSVASLAKMPGPIRAFVSAKIGPMADRGQFFNATDVVERPAPFDRFIRGGTIGQHWFLWYEHGGIAYLEEDRAVRLGSFGVRSHVIAQTTAA